MRRTRQFNKFLFQNSVAFPFTTAQMQIAEARHRIDIRANPSPKLTTLDSVQKIRPVGIFSPDQISPFNTERSEHSVEHQCIHVLPVSERDAFSEPVGSAIAVIP